MLGKHMNAAASLQIVGVAMDMNLWRLVEGVTALVGKFFCTKFFLTAGRGGVGTAEDWWRISGAGGRVSSWGRGQ